jgi:hypothetical protein
LGRDNSSRTGTCTGTGTGGGPTHTSYTLEKWREMIKKKVSSKKKHAKTQNGPYFAEHGATPMFVDNNHGESIATATPKTIAKNEVS